MHDAKPMYEALSVRIPQGTGRPSLWAILPERAVSGEQIGDRNSPQDLTVDGKIELLGGHRATAAEMSQRFVEGSSARFAMYSQLITFSTRSSGM